MELVPLPWDSTFFGFSIARVAGRPDPAELPRLAQEVGVRCAYYFCQASDLTAIRSAELSRFQLADVRIHLEARLADVLSERPPPAASGEFEIDTARDEDLGDLRHIAAELSAYSRFAFDPGFGTAQARRLYKRWVEVSLEGRADLFVVAKNTERTLGFILCRATGPVSAMDLVAVRSGAIGAGVGTALMRRAAIGLQELGYQTVDVVTQGRNPRAVKFYERCGFRVRDVSLVYHGWVGPEQPG